MSLLQLPNANAAFNQLLQPFANAHASKTAQSSRSAPRVHPQTPHRSPSSAVLYSPTHSSARILPSQLQLNHGTMKDLVGGLCPNLVRNAPNPSVLIKESISARMQRRKMSSPCASNGIATRTRSLCGLSCLELLACWDGLPSSVSSSCGIRGKCPGKTLAMRL